VYKIGPLKLLRAYKLI